MNGYETASDVQVVVQGDKVEQETLLAAAPELKRADAARLEPGSQLLLDDSAGLNNRDWSPAGRQQTLQQALQGGAELYEVLRPDPALKTHLRGAVQFGKGGRRIRLTDAFGKALAFGLAGALAKLSYTPSQDDDEEYSEEDFQDGKAGPLKPKARRGKKPVYLLLKKAHP